MRKKQESLRKEEAGREKVQNRELKTGFTQQGAGALVSHCPNMDMRTCLFRKRNFPTGDLK